MNVSRCHLSVEQTNGTCYYMSFITKNSGKKMYGVYCTKVKRDKLCPFHPKYKEYSNVNTT